MAGHIRGMVLLVRQFRMDHFDWRVPRLLSRSPIEQLLIQHSLLDSLFTSLLDARRGSGVWKGV